MKRQFEDIKAITDQQTFERVRAYFENLIQFATRNGFLAEQDADNEYTREMGRIAGMLADYESIYIKFSNLKVKNPLLITIEKEMKKKKLNQRQTADLLEVKENTFSQILSGKRNISMKLAKKLYHTLNIDPKTILEFA